LEQRGEGGGEKGGRLTSFSNQKEEEERKGKGRQLLTMQKLVCFMKGGERKGERRRRSFLLFTFRKTWGIEREGGKRGYVQSFCFLLGKKGGERKGGRPPVLSFKGGGHRETCEKIRTREKRRRRKGGRARF